LLDSLLQEISKDFKQTASNKSEEQYIIIDIRVETFRTL